MQVLDWVEPTFLSTATESSWGLAALERIPQLVFILDDDGRLLHANEKFRQATGTAIGLIAPWSRFLPEEEAWSFHRHWLNAVETGGVIDLEGRVRPEGQEGGRWHLIRLNPERNREGKRHWFGTLTDVHEQKEISREVAGLKLRLQTTLPPKSDSNQGKSRLLSASGERYRRKSELLTELLDSMFEAIVLTDADGNVILSNVAARDLFGDEVWSMPVQEWSKLIEFSARESFRSGEWPLIRALEGIETAEMEISIARAGRERRRFEARGIPLWDELGHVRGGIAVFRDVTARRQMEVQLTHLRKLEAIGHLAAGIAHEINTPIQYVGDNLRFIEDAFERLSSHDAAADINFLKSEVPSAISQSLDGVGRVASIVRAMKEFAAVGSDDPAPVLLNRVVENVVEVTRNEWKYIAQVVCDLDSHLPPIIGQARDLNQCVYHLLMNALEAVKAAKVSMGFICLQTRTDREYVQLTVTDNGVGMAEDVKSKAFDPFFTTKAPGKHTGQGLTIVLATVVKRHRGEVEVSTEEGQGTALTLRLPIKPATEFLQKSGEFNQ